MKLLTSILATLPLMGCAELLYDLGQDKALERCDSLVMPAERTQCRRQASKSFDDYERERVKLGVAQERSSSK